MRGHDRPEKFRTERETEGYCLIDAEIGLLLFCLPTVVSVDISQQIAEQNPFAVGVDSLSRRRKPRWS